MGVVRVGRFCRSSRSRKHVVYVQRSQHPSEQWSPRTMLLPEPTFARAQQAMTGASPSLPKPADCIFLVSPHLEYSKKVFSCSNLSFSLSTELTAPEVGDTSARSAEACGVLCQETPNCVAFLFGRRHGGCSNFLGSCLLYASCSPEHNPCWEHYLLLS